MWSLVMFDLPVKTKLQRSKANRYRHLLIDLGWSREQYSVYVRYVPTGTSVVPEIMQMRQAVPSQGRVEILAITDQQWSKALRFFNAQEEGPASPPDLLTLF